jgi:heterodisulfide reductase subunit B
MTTTGNRVYAYYPGCSQMATNKAYDISTRSVARALGLEMVELDDWNCCGATAYVAIQEKRAFVLSARNLALAEKTGRELVTACSACYVVLKKLNKYMAQNAQLRAEIRDALAAGGMTYGGKVSVRHFLDILVHEVGEQGIREAVKRPLTGLNVVPYYGCQVSRPFGEIDDEEFPESLDRLAGWLGAEPLAFPLKAKCCGGLMMTTQPAIGQRLTGKILKGAKKLGADCIMTCCPLCQMNLEAYQRRLGVAGDGDDGIPVLYFTQLVGHALGLGTRELALKDSLTPVEAMLLEKVASP